MSNMRLIDGIVRALVVLVGKAVGGGVSRPVGR